MRQAVTALFRATLFVATCLAYPSPAGEPDPVLQAALSLQAAGKSESAEQLFYSVLVKDPDNSVALFEAGKLLIKNGDKATGHEFLRKALRQAGSQHTEQIKSILKNGPAMQLEAALQEYRVTVEQIVNKDNTDLTREVALERTKKLGLEIKITARDKAFLQYAVVELRQPLSAPVVTLQEGASRVMNFAQPFNAPLGLCGLKFQQIRNGEAQQPVLRAVQAGKVFVACTEETAKRIKATPTSHVLSAGGENFSVFALQLTAGQTVAFKDQAIVFAAEMTVIAGK